MTDDERLAELPAYIRKRAVDYLRTALPEDVKQLVRDIHAKHGEHWIHFMSVLNLPDGRRIPRGHFGWGMAVRNALRTEAGIGDAALPDGNWDDYYIPLVEIACGIRPEPSAEKGDA